MKEKNGLKWNTLGIVVEFLKHSVGILVFSIVLYYINIDFSFGKALLQGVIMWFVIEGVLSMFKSGMEIGAELKKGSEE